MCFSATASFAVGVPLIALGAMTLARAERAADKPFAAIPLLFGIQQCVEGGLWIALHNDLVLLQSLTTYLFTLFSHIVWPLLTPYAVSRLEHAPGVWRSRLMRLFRLIGVVVAVMLFALVASQPLTAVGGEHIVYVTLFFYGWPMLLLYIVATGVALLCSSHGPVRLFGLLVLIFFVVAYGLYTEAFFSVWCFFAAPLSVIVYLYFRRPAPISPGFMPRGK